MFAVNKELHSKYGMYYSQNGWDIPNECNFRKFRIVSIPRFKFQNLALTK